MPVITVQHIEAVIEILDARSRDLSWDHTDSGYEASRMLDLITETLRMLIREAQS